MVLYLSATAAKYIMCQNTMESKILHKPILYQYYADALYIIRQLYICKKLYVFIYETYKHMLTISTKSRTFIMFIDKMLKIAKG